ncbi:MAG: GTP 3',8-cyclase MoaA [Gammaproteobacteria bacterium]|nr:GTP 3',8-cyclase MoaA [Gammaproteobacteria bacterium]
MSAATPQSANSLPRDRRGRPLRDLRVSVTDRCNFRCNYCMPRDAFGRGHRFLPKRELLRFEEIETLARAFTGLGVHKIRLTGGEPLLRNDLEDLVARLAQLDELDDLALTTNASLLTRARADSLRRAGIRRVNISLDALDERVYRQINQIDSPLGDVLSGIEHALGAGFDAVKINMVVQKGVNDGEILPMARRFRGSGAILRFIEFMDVGNHNRWSLGRVCTAREILETIAAAHPLEALEANHRGEVAKRWRYADGGGEIGVIASVSEPFCGGPARPRPLAVCVHSTSPFPLPRFFTPQWPRPPRRAPGMRAHAAPSWRPRARAAAPRPPRWPPPSG